MPKPHKFFTALVLATILGVATGHAEAIAQTRPDAATLTAADNPYDVKAGTTQAPYGDAMPAIVKNYLRAAPYIGTGGAIKLDAFPTLKELGFKTIINLNTDQQGAIEEGKAAKRAGLAYVRIPVAAHGPDAAKVAEFSQYANDPGHYPILVHCLSANRAGAMWTLYRFRHGVPEKIAVEEGRTIGLKPGREAIIAKQLKQPPSGE